MATASHRLSAQGPGPGCRGKRTPKQQTRHQNDAPGNPVVRHQAISPEQHGGKTGGDQTGAEINVGTDRDHPRQEQTVTGPHRPEVHALAAAAAA